MGEPTMVEFSLILFALTVIESVTRRFRRKMWQKRKSQRL